MFLFSRSFTWKRPKNMLTLPTSLYISRKKGNTTHTYRAKSNKKKHVENEIMHFTRVYDSQGVKIENNQKMSEEPPKPYFYQTERKQMPVTDFELPGFCNNV
jgi:hypothetical protein